MRVLSLLFIFTGVLAASHALAEDEGQRTERADVRGDIHGSTSTFTFPAHLSPEDRALAQAVATAIVDEILAYRYTGFSDVAMVSLTVYADDCTIHVLHRLYPYGELYREARWLSDDLAELNYRETYIRYHTVPMNRGDCGHSVDKAHWLVDMVRQEGIDVTVTYETQQREPSIARERQRNLLAHADDPDYEDDTDWAIRRVDRLMACWESIYQSEDD